MNIFVYMEITFIAKSRRAFFTFKRLDLGAKMNVFMRLKILFPGKSRRTLLTLKRLETDMSFFMGSKIAFFRKRRRT